MKDAEADALRGTLVARARAKGITLAELGRQAEENIPSFNAQLKVRPYAHCCQRVASIFAPRYMLAY